MVLLRWLILWVQVTFLRPESPQSSLLPALAQDLHCCIELHFTVVISHVCKGVDSMKLISEYLRLELFFLQVSKGESNFASLRIGSFMFLTSLEQKGSCEVSHECDGNLTPITGCLWYFRTLVIHVVKKSVYLFTFCWSFHFYWSMNYFGGYPKCRDWCGMNEVSPGWLTLLALFPWNWDMNLNLLWN